MLNKGVQGVDRIFPPKFGFWGYFSLIFHVFPGFWQWFSCFWGLLPVFQYKQYTQIYIINKFTLSLCYNSHCLVADRPNRKEALLFQKGIMRDQKDQREPKKEFSNFTHWCPRSLKLIQTLFNLRPTNYFSLTCLNRSIWVLRSQGWSKHQINRKNKQNQLAFLNVAT